MQAVQVPQPLTPILSTFLSPGWTPGCALWRIDAAEDLACCGGKSRKDHCPTCCIPAAAADSGGGPGGGAAGYSRLAAISLRIPLWPG